jgi:hypothetical protein
MAESEVEKRSEIQEYGLDPLDICIVVRLFERAPGGQIGMTKIRLPGWIYGHAQQGSQFKRTEACLFQQFPSGRGFCARIARINYAPGQTKTYFAKSMTIFICQYDFVVLRERNDIHPIWALKDVIG